MIAQGYGWSFERSMPWTSDVATIEYWCGDVLGNMYVYKEFDADYIFDLREWGLIWKNVCAPSLSYGLDYESDP